MIAVCACFPREVQWFRAPTGVSVVRTPMGARAESGIEAWSERNGAPSMLVSTGFSGGLTETLETGDLVLAETILSGEEEIRADLGWVDRVRIALAQDGMEAAVGQFASSGAVASPQEKKRLAAEGSLAVDMESGPLATWAQQRDVPFLALRVVLDPAWLEIPFTGARAVWLSVLRHPAATLDLARRSKKAGCVLGRALRTVVEKIGNEAS